MNPARSLATAVFQHAWALESALGLHHLPARRRPARRAALEEPRPARRRVTRARDAPPRGLVSRPGSGRNALALVGRHAVGAAGVRRTRPRTTRPRTRARVRRAAARSRRGVSGNGFAGRWSAYAVARARASAWRSRVAVCDFRDDDPDAGDRRHRAIPSSVVAFDVAGAPVRLVVVGVHRCSSSGGCTTRGGSRICSAGRRSRARTLGAFSVLIPIVNFWWPYEAIRDCYPPGGRSAVALRWFVLSCVVPCRWCSSRSLVAALGVAPAWSRAVVVVIAGARARADPGRARLAADRRCRRDAARAASARDADRGALLLRRAVAAEREQQVLVQLHPHGVVRVDARRREPLVLAVVDPLARGAQPRPVARRSASRRVAALRRIGPTRSSIATSRSTTAQSYVGSRWSLGAPPGRTCQSLQTRISSWLSARKRW